MEYIDIRPRIIKAEQWSPSCGIKAERGESGNYYYKGQLIYPGDYIHENGEVERRIEFEKKYVKAEGLKW